MNLRNLLSLTAVRGATILTATASTPPPADLINALAQLALAAIGLYDLIKASRGQK